MYAITYKTSEHGYGDGGNGVDATPTLCNPRIHAPNTYDTHPGRKVERRQITPINNEDLSAEVRTYLDGATLYSVAPKDKAASNNLIIGAYLREHGVNIGHTPNGITLLAATAHGKEPDLFIRNLTPGAYHTLGTEWYDVGKPNLMLPDEDRYADDTYVGIAPPQQTYAAALLWWDQYTTTLTANHIGYTYLDVWHDEPIAGPQGLELLYHIKYTTTRDGG